MLLCLGAIVILFSFAGCEDLHTSPGGGNDSVIVLPPPVLDSQISVEQAMQTRRSVRTYSLEPLVLSEVSQLLWAAQGLTNPVGLRTVPSAGALYPLEIYVVAGNVTDLPAGIYQYQYQDHSLLLTSTGDKREDLFEASLHQSAVRDAALVLVISAVYERTTVKYGERGVRYVHMEVGHAAQNIYLQAESLELGTVLVGAFH